MAITVSIFLLLQYYFGPDGKRYRSRAEVRKPTPFPLVLPVICS